MKAETLRIGNQIYNHKGKIITVCIETLVYLTNYPDEAEKFKPIPMSDEVCQKLAFEKNNTGYPRGHVDFFEWYEKEVPVIGELYQSNNKSYLCASNHEEFKIWYLHEYQNLVFILTGIEIKID